MVLVGGVVIKAESDWQDGRPQVAVGRQLLHLLHSSLNSAVGCMDVG